MTSDDAPGGGRIRMHVFEPSGRVVWTAVGQDEHWLDPDLGYCSCMAYHFRTGCPHLRDAARPDARRMIRFSDEEFNGFIAALVGDTHR